MAPTKPRNLVHKALIAPAHRGIFQFPRALFISAIAAALDFGVLILLHKYYGWNKYYASTVSFLLGGVLQYIACSIWVFPSAPKNVTVGFTTFTLLSLVALGITNSTIWIFQQWQLDVVFAKIVALGLSFFWNFFSRKYLIFHGMLDDFLVRMQNKFVTPIPEVITPTPDPLLSPIERTITQHEVEKS